MRPTTTPKEGDVLPSSDMRRAVMRAEDAVKERAEAAERDAGHGREAAAKPSSRIARLFASIRGVIGRR
jgi:hypothetical protein